MFSAASERPRHIAASALRGAGLIDKDKDKDARMSDSSAGGAKRTAKVRSHKTRPSDNIKDPGTSSRASLLAARLSGSSSAPISIRGASKQLALSSSRLPRRSLDANRRGPISPGTVSVSAHSVDVWREFVQKRWNPEAQFLNLEHIATDETLKKINRAAGGPSAKEAAVVFKLASQLKPEVLSISLANNGLTNAQPLQTLSHYLPGLRNLSLANNKLKLWKDLDYLSARKGRFLHLKELVMNGNPMREDQIPTNRLDKYRAISEVLRRFPTLELLDSEAIVKINFDAPGPSTIPAPSSGRGPASFPVHMAGALIAPGMEGFVAEFLTKFFTVYDSSRLSLTDVYGPSATFSFSANTSIPPRARIQGHHNSAAMPNQKKLEWTPYITNGSRNLSRVSTLARAEHSLHTGPEEITKKLTSLPGTRHDISAQEKFVVDAWPVQGVLPAPGDAGTVLFITVHGQFEEQPSHGVRSFDRSFILAPAADDSRAKMTGWPVVILSDQLVIRAYSSHEAWTPGPIRMPPQESAPTSSEHTSIQTQPTLLNIPPMASQPAVGNDPMLASLPEPQRMYVIELSARTGLNAEYSIQCLQGNGWDPQKALANFEQVRPNLPREAFI
ncbi:NTF2-like protein [Ramaria rubella]|nr:NTF2-like protein [Ramaria rubella]